ncbi:MAG: rod shape-determining protein MreC [Candidatus Pacebacteria bacterium]|nr:rod shape-determining protein MreC [Candidatus Paceibacterota bacterium]
MEFSLQSGSLKSPATLLAENEALKVRIQELAVQDASADVIRTQNSDLLAVLGRPDLSLISFNTNTETTISSSSATSTPVSNISKLFSSIHPADGRVLAAVLVRPPVAHYDELIVDVGLDHNIVPGMKVYAPGNILIGTTTDVLGQTSKVTLFSSVGQTYPVLIGSSHIPANAIGRGGGQYEAQVPQATKIAQGDVVLDSSLTDGPFGIVTAVLSNPADPFETVLFSPGINVYQLRWVLISPSGSSQGSSMIQKPLVPVSSNTSSIKSTSTKVKK